MKKVLLAIGTVIVSLTGLYAQVGIGNVIIDPYVGFPQTNSIRVEPEGATNYKLNGGWLAYGGRLEYMIADNFGLGIDVNYVVSGSNYDIITTDSTYNSTTNSYDVTTHDYNWDYTAKKLRIMLRLNYHFVQTDKVDVYTGFAAGYKHVKRDWTIEDPNGSSDIFDLKKALIPISFKIALGTRYYFTNNIGAMVEIGLGGGTVMQAGLSFKI